ncbi:MAB_1171c family putative transporter [Streptomyces sp. NPDC050844]|uniref:MAB_1171c family putative transporter n=1 Tax=Streptomyces sp. NPDC050844 TaxID=3155790 RepID=UPI00340997AC
MTLSDLRSFGIELETAGVACMWLAVILRAPTAARSREQRPLWLAVMGAAVAVTFHLEWVNELVHQAVTPTHLTALARNLFGVLASAAVLDFVLMAARGRHTYSLYGFAGSVIATLTWLDTTADSHLHHTIPPAGPPSPTTAYWAVLVTVNLGTNVVCAAACWWYSRASHNPSLRAGLRLFGLGAFFAGAYWLLSALYIGIRLPWIPSTTPLLLGCYALARASAICVPLATATALTLRRMRLLRKLQPLWRDLINAVPEIHLAQTHQHRRLGYLRSPGPLDLHLYRTVIEIRDAILSLRSYIPPTVLNDVLTHLAHTTSPPADTDPHVTACWLRIARHTKAKGTPPLHTNPAPPLLGGTDLPSEITFLCHVAKADTSPHIRKLATHLSHQHTPT